jgi:hypothetical protein
MSLSGLSAVARHPTASRLLACAVCIAVTACAGSRGPRVYEQESFDGRAGFSREFVASPVDTCNAARRVLLSEGYVATMANPEQLQAHKRFQPDGETHVQIEFNLVCAPSARTLPTAALFVSAVQDRYTVKKSSTSASVGVGPIGSISLPISSSSDSLVKVASETIPAGAFYERFFDGVERVLAEQKGLE